jgi:sugar phosphate isomerase/epimerase
MRGLAAWSSQGEDFMPDRRQFIRSAAAAGLAAGSLPFAISCGAQQQPLFSISLAQWSLNRRLFAGDLDALEFPAFTRDTFGIEAVEYVNQFFMDKAGDRPWLTQLKQRCDDSGVRSLLIMCDREGNLGDPDNAARTTAVENHYKWIEAAEFLGCHSVRVNAGSAGSWDEQQRLATDGLRRLSEFAADFGLNVIVENHGGLSSNGQWLSEVIAAVGLDNCGTLPDFGNFFITRQPPDEYDRYLGVEQLMPFAKGVSAKSYGFDAAGNETTIDFERMLRLVLDAGYRGYVGVEWEGQNPGDVEGIRLTQQLLERVRQTLADDYADAASSG